VSEYGGEELPYVWSCQSRRSWRVDEAFQTAKKIELSREIVPRKYGRGWSDAVE
jgi:hypothetical protein